jgi:hypothetical protein
MPAHWRALSQRCYSLNALSTKGETPAWVLAKSRLEGGDSIRIERDATSFP